MFSTLEKVKRLEQYLAVDNSTVDPVLDTTIDKLLAREQARIVELKTRLQEQCALFEQNYTLSSEDFYKQYQAGQMGDETDYVEWAATIEMLANLDKRLAS
ncbi:MAG: hypothetical protein Fur0044_22990 [Anaerolineae bacterium]|nr:hypothetical protein [Anaerolineales bacterium]MCQ3979013.1 hypothetical protein [Anaerolineae bacterium]